jgi:hypothetical protein
MREKVFVLNLTRAEIALSVKLFSPQFTQRFCGPFSTPHITQWLHWAFPPELKWQGH